MTATEILTSTPITMWPASATATPMLFRRSRGRQQGSTRTRAICMKPCSITPKGCSPPSRHVMFTCSGSEANDLALRVAGTCTGGTGFVVTETAYHGVTSTLVELSPSLGLPLAKDSRVRLVPAPRPAGDHTGEIFARHVGDALDDMKRSGIRPAGLLVDTIFSSDGVLADPPGYLRPAVEAFRAAGGLFIADEVQPDFGRTGGEMWGFARHGVIPDLVTMGKPMGNGHPVAGMAARPELLAEFGARSRYFNTFGGNPVSAAAGIAVLEVIASEGLMENARRTGAYLLEQLRQLQSRHALIAEIRGAGRRAPARRHRRDASPRRDQADRQPAARTARPDQRRRTACQCPQDPAAAGVRHRTRRLVDRETRSSAAAGKFRHVTGVRLFLDSHCRRGLSNRVRCWSIKLTSCSPSPTRPDPPPHFDRRRD
jgi:4-aminobutyrate aminotransferase-like enzyme